MEYELCPEALEHVIRKVHEDFQSSLIFTENGIATADDTRRMAFIRRALQGMENCLNERRSSFPGPGSVVLRMSRFSRTPETSPDLK